MIQYDKIYFQEKLLPAWRNSNHPLPGQIVTTRNTKILLCYLEIVMDCFAIMFSIIRRSKVNTAFTIGNLLFLMLGIWSTMKLHFWGLVAHATYSIAMVGGYVIYKVIDTIVIENMDQEAAN